MDRKRLPFILIYCLLLILVTVAVYSRVQQNAFIDLDDSVYVTQNPVVQQGLTWNTLVWALTSVHRSGNWHPLTWLSHALDCQLYGLNPSGHHLTNLFFHVANVVLLFLILVRGTGATGRSMAVAALFALHPVNVESVAWVAERKNVLSTLLFLLALGTYGWYALKPGVKRYIVVTVFFLLALASKPMVITLPFVFLLLDFWPLQRVRKQNCPQPSRKEKMRRKERAERSSMRQLPFLSLLREKLPWMALCVASAIITILAQSSAGAIEATMRIPFGVRLENAINSYVGYLAIAFWPARLAAYYPYPYRGIAFGQVAAETCLLLAISGLAWSQRRTRPYLVTGWLWYLGTSVPVIGFIQVGNQAMADRYAYVPLVGIFVMTVWALGDLADRNQVNTSVRATTAVVILGLLSFVTWRQIGYWRSDYDLWSHAVNVTKNNVLAEANLARSLRLLGRPQDALPHYQEAAELSPEDPIRHLNLAVDLAECDRLQDAVAEYKNALRFISDDTKKAQIYESLAALYAALNDYSKVRESYGQALQIDPQHADAMVRHLSESIAAQPTGESYLQLGLLQEQAGHSSEARLAYEQALKLEPELAEAKQSLAAIERRSP